MPDRLRNIVLALNKLAESYGFPVIWSLHPRTRSWLDKLSLDLHRLIRCCTPFDLFDFVKLEQSSFCVLTDSGTVQEECCIFHVPAITIRDTTERPETIACGSNILTGCCIEKILSGVELVTKNQYQWEVPKEYLDRNVSDKVIRMILGNA